MKLLLTSIKRHLATELFHRAGSFAWLGGVVALMALLPQQADAHGELLIRIAETTKKIEAATNNAQLYLDRGELYREDKNWAAAKADYDHAAVLDPNLATVDFCRAKMLDDSGEFESARALFDKILSGNPTDGEAFVGRARVLLKLNQRPAAIEDFQSGLQWLPKPKMEYFLELAQAMAAEGKPEDALRVLDSGIAKFGPLIPLQTLAVELELGQKNRSAAVLRLDTIIERAFRKEDWLAKRGDVLFTAGRLAEAKKSFEEALAAISILPWRLQQGPAMQKLQSHVHSALDKMAAPTFSLNAKNEN